MGFFDRKPKQPQKTISLVSEDCSVFEALCRHLKIEYTVKQSDDGRYDYSFDEDRFDEIRPYFRSTPQVTTEPDTDSEPEKIPAVETTNSFDNLLGNAQKRSAESTPRRKQSVREQLHKTPVAAPATTPTPDPEPTPEATPAPTDIENRWAQEKLAEELKEIQEEIDDAENLLDEEPGPETTSKPKKKRKSAGRTNQIMTRLTDSELVQFQRRVKKSGLAQGEYLRSAALQGQIVIQERSVSDVAMLDEIALIRAELGRQGGLLKMLIKPNEGQRELAPEEWNELINLIRDMEQIKRRLSDMEVAVLHGNRKAQDK